MMTTTIVIAIFLNVVMAFIHAYKIGKNQKIEHGYWAAGYFIICLGVCLLMTEWYYIFPMLLIRPVVFDPLLNILRKREPFEVSLTTTSIIDQWEVRLLGGNGFLHWGAWVVLTIISIVLINVFK